MEDGRNLFIVWRKIISCTEKCAFKQVILRAVVGGIVTVFNIRPTLASLKTMS